MNDEHRHEDHAEEFRDHLIKTGKISPNDDVKVLELNPCRDHFAQLRDEVEKYEQSKSIMSPDKETATRRLADLSETGVPTLANFDPLLGALFELMRRYVEAVMQGTDQEREEVGALGGCPLCTIARSCKLGNCPKDCAALWMFRAAEYSANVVTRLRIEEDSWDADIDPE